LTIHWENIGESFKEDFNKIDPSENRLLTPFDYNSIMLYGPRFGSIDGNSTTIEPKLEGFKMLEVCFRQIFQI